MPETFYTNFDKFLQTPLGTKLVRLPIVKKVLASGAKGVNQPQGKSDKEIIKDLVSGNKSFYSVDRKNGSNEIDTYLFGVPYNTPFNGDTTIGPQYTNYIASVFPEYNGQVKTYNTHFGDTLYVDTSARPYISDLIQSGKTTGMRMGTMENYPSYIKTFEDDRPYDSGGHLATFTVNGHDTVANMSDIYQFDGTKKDYNASGNAGFIHKVGISMLDRAGKPFIVRQNNIPVVFKEILPKDYKTDLQEKLGKFLAHFGDAYDLNLPKQLTDQQILEIFTHKPELTGDDILQFMEQKGYLTLRRKQGGALNYFDYFK